jgi:hypothetical protein
VNRSVRRFLLSLSALVIAGLSAPRAAVANSSSCAFCYGYCPEGSFAIAVCQTQCREPSTTATCDDPYNVCPGQVFVWCQGMVIEM